MSPVTLSKSDSVVLPKVSCRACRTPQRSPKELLIANANTGFGRERLWLEAGKAVE
jgi:hypothetical protein